MRKTKVEILNETAAYYNNSNRSTNPDYDESRRGEYYYQVAACLYNGPDGKHCAFARCCTDPSSLDKFENKGVCVIEHELYLKDEYKGHSNSFWESVQRFHDKDKYWGNSGLTTQGKERLELLIEEYGDNEDDCPF